MSGLFVGSAQLPRSLNGTPTCLRSTSCSGRRARRTPSSHAWRRAVLALHDLQAAFADALLGGSALPGGNGASGAEADGARVIGLIAGDGLAPEARLAIYQHHVTSSLTAVLEGAYPVVCWLVDPRFFAYAAEVYIRANPPASPCLQEYGASFADFLRSFPPCRHLAYLPDVARLEGAMHSALRP